MIYPINEIFETIQGEAHWTGMPSVFIRLQGCPVGCAWCDTKHTWDVKKEAKIPITLMLFKQTDTDQHSTMNVAEIIEVLNKYKAQHIVLTGGEPCLYDLNELTTAIIESGRTCQIETSGTFPIQANEQVWVTVSPKIDMTGGLKVLNKAVTRASEIKYPIGKSADVLKLQQEIIPLINSKKIDVWLQPLSQNTKATEICIATAIQYGYRLSIQTHKFINVR
jgi:7-carboxy-7-deazaguanine synthase